MSPMTLETRTRMFAAAAVLAASVTLPPGAAGAPSPTADLSPCLPGPPVGPPVMMPTTITTIGQAYYCILDNYYNGPILDARSLLVPAFVGLTQALQRRGLDQAGATMPPLTGKNDRDWAAFRQVYEQVDARLPQDPGVRQAIAEATMRGMVEGLHDNHTEWQRGLTPNLSGIILSGFRGVDDLDPAVTEPFFALDVSGPATKAGVLPGDEILAVNGIPPIVNHVPSVGALKWITDLRSAASVELTLHRPATDSTFTVTLFGGPPAPPPPGPAVTLVNGNVAYAKLLGFGIESVDQVLAAVADLGRSLRGIILDLRGNTGGDPDAVNRLLGAFVHDRITGYSCNVKDHCTASRTDDSVALLNRPLVVLTSRKCASACDHFAAAVKDLRVGALVGTRTGGVISGLAERYILDDGSSIQLPKFSGLAANGEVINEIGVAPDYYAPITAADLSAGRDYALTTAVTLLR